MCELDASTEVVVYAKLPRGFFIPTPVGNYNPDWAIAFQQGRVKHVYFVAETKGSMSSMDLRKIEESKNHLPEICQSEEGPHHPPGKTEFGPPHRPILRRMNALTMGAVPS